MRRIIIIEDDAVPSVFIPNLLEWDHNNPCLRCPNHPNNNGGKTVICNCTLGGMKITC